MGSTSLKLGRNWTASELRKLPAHERDAILEAAAALAEADYRNNPDLTAFEAFGKEHANWMNRIWCWIVCRCAVNAAFAKRQSAVKQLRQREHDHAPATADYPASDCSARWQCAVPLEATDHPRAAEAAARLLPWLREVDCDAEIDPIERAELMTPLGGLSPSERIDVNWASEGAAFYRWTLGLGDPLDCASPADQSAVISTLRILHADALELERAATVRAMRELEEACRQFVVIRSILQQGRILIVGQHRRTGRGGHCEARREETGRSGHRGRRQRHRPRNRYRLHLDAARTKSSLRILFRPRTRGTVAIQ